MQDVITQLVAAGLELDGPVEYGRLVRCRADGDRGMVRAGVAGDEIEGDRRG